MTTQTIIIYRLGSLGDAVVALPCFNAVAKYFPDAKRLVLTNIQVSAKATPLLAVLGQNGEIVDEAIAYPVGTRSPAILWKLIRDLKSKNADTLVYMMPNRGGAAAWRDWLFFKFAGFKHIMAFPKTSDLRKNRINSQNGIEEPEVERLVRCFNEFGPIDLTDRSVWNLHLTPEELEIGNAILEPFRGGAYIALNMGGKAQEKDWGLGNWVELFDRLKGDFGDFGLLVVGAAVDLERAQTFLDGWQGPVVNGCGKLNPRQSAAAMEGATVFIGHDSGPLHLAAAMNVACVGLFGNFNRPKTWHPYGKKVSIIHEMAGMSAIKVEDVEAEIRAFLAKAT